MFFYEQSYPGLGDPRYGDSKDSVLQTCWMIFISSASEAVIISNRQTDTRTASWKTH